MKGTCRYLVTLKEKQKSALQSK